MNPITARHCQNIKNLVDTAISKGLFNNSEAVMQMVSSFEFVMAIVRKSEGDNSERLMPGKSNDGIETKMPI